MLACVCSVKDHRLSRRQGVRTTMTHSVLQSKGFVWNDGHYVAVRSDRLLTDVNCTCQQVRTYTFFVFLYGHLCQNMLSDSSSLLRDMFVTSLISPTSPRNVEETFVSFFVFLQFFCCFRPAVKSLRTLSF